MYHTMRTCPGCVNRRIEIDNENVIDDGVTQQNKSAVK